MSDRGRASVATNLAGARYVEEMRRLIEDVGKGEVSKSDGVLASAYLLGLTDMAHLHAAALEGMSVHDEVARIDAKVLGFRRGQFGDVGE